MEPQVATNPTEQSEGNGYFYLEEERLIGYLQASPQDEALKLFARRAPEAADQLGAANIMDAYVTHCVYTPHEAEALKKQLYPLGAKLQAHVATYGWMPTPTIEPESPSRPHTKAGGNGKKNGLTQQQKEANFTARKARLAEAETRIHARMERLDEQVSLLSTILEPSTPNTESLNDATRIHYQMLYAHVNQKYANAARPLLEEATKYLGRGTVDKELKSHIKDNFLASSFLIAVLMYRLNDRPIPHNPKTPEWKRFARTAYALALGMQEDLEHTQETSPSIQPSKISLHQLSEYSRLATSCRPIDFSDYNKPFPNQHLEDIYELIDEIAFSGAI